eukprot:CAMPEP_0203794592 /NCGR_PEP_ID=MMETSP0100_2-20121128/6609_1 /ASSEMBLY_ACC=CAM_ASM_000210 /TAXON_ID=96639 /ORGANISM=" , Strain NY0313808BC1" /LENGTH=585 /DNA_ID=CAMNT_0050698705 /DNA_START=227 /DNA_END=1984 /DNA_ORIENTATION=-
MVGHIPAEDCKEAFDTKNFDKVTEHIMRLIETGAKCPMSKEALRKDTSISMLPKHTISSSEGVVTAVDHYLCVCLDNGGDTKKLDKQCEDAVKIACTVGHIPQPDCYASFDEKNHANIVNHIMKLIDRGANCAQKLVTKKTVHCPHPPCYNTTRHSKHEPTKKDHFLCPCMDDHESVMCKDLVLKACKDGHIPRTDCELAEKADYRHAVNRHVLHLIDHGAECSLEGSMKFTNNRCHCKNEWKASNGELMKFPNNCNDPGQEKGFDWCETFPSEGCVGVGDSMSWDRCDRPQRPKYHVGEFVNTVAGRVSPVDHYLCICIDKNSNDEVCNAAVKAGCSVGHIPSEECANSFQKEDHSGISTHILELIANGARCHNIDSVAGVSSETGVIPSSNKLKVAVVTVLSTGMVLAPARKDLLGIDVAIAQMAMSTTQIVRQKETVLLHVNMVHVILPRGNVYALQTDRVRDAKSVHPDTLGNLAPHRFLGHVVSGAGALLILGIAAVYACCCTPLGAQYVSKLRGMQNSQHAEYSRLNNDFFFEGEENTLDVEEEMVAAESLAGTEFPTPVPTAESGSNQEPIPHTGLAI